MNKKLIALAIAGAFAAPVAMADNSNDVIYGEFAGSVDYVDGGSYNTPGGLNANSSERRGRVSSNNSFLGFKGTEDLGNGMSAIWQYEQSIAIDKQNINNNANDTNPGLTSNQSRRQTFVGLSSKQMGSLTVGIHESPFKTSTGPLDIFGQHTLADYRNIWGTAGSLGNVASIRAENSVMYTSPDLAGFTIKALGAAQNEAGNNTATSAVDNPHYYSAGATYANGPIFAALAYEDNMSATAAGSTSVVGIVAGVPAVITTPTAAGDFAYKNWRAGVGYSIVGIKFGLAYERIQGKGTGQSIAPPGVSTMQGVRRSAWYLPVSYQMGSNTLKFAYTRASKSNQKSSAGIDLSGNDGAKQFSVGFDHAMSKRTNVYALYSQVRNDANGVYSLGGGGTGIASVAAASYGEDPKGFSIGMVHKF